jgi:hypothetical protein
MAINAKKLRELVDREMERLEDDRVKRHIRALLVEPSPVMRRWNYAHDQRFPRWSVLNDPESDTGIAYCEFGFGPERPWGLVWLTGDEDQMSMGQDSAWYATFLDAFCESQATGPLPIWQVFRGPWSKLEPMTGEGSLKETERRVAEFQAADPASNYFSHHDIRYGRRKSD